MQNGSRKAPFLYAQNVVERFAKNAIIASVEQIMLTGDSK